jgi:hypothetical protein
MARMPPPPPDALPRRRPTNLEEFKSLFVTRRPPPPPVHPFRPRPTDIIVATNPKCGTTWTQQIVHGLRSRGSMDFEEISLVVPWIESAHLLGMDLDAPQVAEPRAFKTHLPWEMLPKGGRNIYVMRAPGDALVSSYHFHSGWMFEHGALSLEEFALGFFLEHPTPRSFWRQLRSWWEQRQREDVLMLSYEDMKQDVGGAVRRIATFMGLQPDEECVALVIRQSSFEFMRAHERQFDDHPTTERINRLLGLPADSKTTKVRTGRVGDAQALTPRLTEALDEAWERELGGPLGIRSYSEMRALLHAGV